MGFRLDHVVIAVRDLDEAIADYRALGFNVQPGGRHSIGHTHNALVVFEDGAYLELIAWLAPDPAHKWYGLYTKHGEGLVDFALVPDDLARSVAEAAERGLALEGPIEGGRLRPDGKVLQWQLAIPATRDLPFLCGDVTPRDWRVPPGEARRHANGAVGIANIVVGVRDLEASLRRYNALLPEASFHAREHVAAISVGASAMSLMQLSAGNGLATREGPCILSLRADRGEPMHMLDPARTHGVALQIGTLRLSPLVQD